MELPRIYLRGNNCKKWQGIAQNVLLQSNFNQDFDVNQELSLSVDDLESQFEEYELKLSAQVKKIEVHKPARLLKKRLRSPDFNGFKNLKSGLRGTHRNEIVDGNQNTNFGTFRRSSCKCLCCGSASQHQSKIDQQYPLQVIAMHQKEEMIEKVVACIEKQDYMINTYDLRDPLNRQKLKKGIHSTLLRVISENQKIMQQFSEEFGDQISKRQRKSIMRSGSSEEITMIQTFQIQEELQKSQDLQNLIDQNETDIIQKPTYLKLLSAKQKLLISMKQTSVLRSYDSGSIRLLPFESVIQQFGFKKKLSNFHLQDNLWFGKNQSSPSSMADSLSQPSQSKVQISSINIKKTVKHHTLKLDEKTQNIKYLNSYNKNQIMNDFVTKQPMRSSIKHKPSQSMGQLTKILGKACPTTESKINQKSQQSIVDGQILNTYLKYPNFRGINSSVHVRRTNSIKNSYHFESPQLFNKIQCFTRKNASLYQIASNTPIAQ